MGAIYLSPYIDTAYVYIGRYPIPIRPNPEYPRRQAFLRCFFSFPFPPLRTSCSQRNGFPFDDDVDNDASHGYILPVQVQTLGTAGQLLLFLASAFCCSSCMFMSASSSKVIYIIHCIHCLLSVHSPCFWLNVIICAGTRPFHWLPVRIGAVLS